jgi:Novel STAND NTPase 1
MNVSNPAATGSSGPAFETKVAAACLTLLLTRGAPLCLGAGTLQTVHLQARHLDHGWQTDDLLLEATDPAGQSMKAALQVKRSFVVSEEDAECLKTLRGALSDFRNSAHFDSQRDVVALIVSSISAKVARYLRTLLDCARASTSEIDMSRRLAIPDYLGKPALNYYKTIKAILAGADNGVPSEKELWEFLRCFQVVDIDLNVTGGFAETMMRSLLVTTSLDSDAGVADATWNELVTMALVDAGSAKSYVRETLPSNLLQRHSKASRFSNGVSLLLEDSRIVAAEIRTTIAETTAIPRRELTGELCRLIGTSPLVFVTGAAGSGKSSLVKSALSAATKGGVSFAFRAVSLAGHHINDVLHRFGLSLAALQAQTVMQGRKVLWIESLERLMEKPADQRAAFLDLLRALKLDPTWRLVVTCRDYSAETVRTAFFSEVGLTPADIDVGELSDGELDDVTVDFPSLERPLSNPTLRSLLRNPFFLDKAAKMNWPVAERLPTTERAFREKVWNEVVRRVDEDMESGLPKLREQVLVEVALRRAKALEPGVAANDLDSRALARLVRDSLLQAPSPNSDLYAPAHVFLKTGR